MSVNDEDDDNVLARVVKGPRVQQAAFPEVAEIALPPKKARLPCIICGADLIYDAPDPQTGKTVEAMNIPVETQPFVCQKCWWAAKDTVRAALIPDIGDVSEYSDDYAMAQAENALNYNEMMARTLIEMARHGYLGQSKRE